MICSECNCEREDRDFYGTKICYRCVYAKKKGIKPKELNLNCDICKKPIPEKEEGVHRKRTKYCSKACCDEARRIHNINYQKTKMGKTVSTIKYYESCFDFQDSRESADFLDLY